MNISGTGGVFKKIVFRVVGCGGRPRFFENLPDPLEPLVQAQSLSL
jgi:hypothetical protein